MDNSKAQEDEPVAWLNPANGVVIDKVRKKQGDGYPQFNVPLYTRPVVIHEPGNMIHNEQEDKPVAEIKLIHGLPKVVAIAGYGDLIPGSLLYTRSDDKLRKAAEEAEKLLTDLESGSGFESNEEYAVLENLRAALKGNKPL